MMPYTIALDMRSRRKAIKESTVGKSSKAISSRTFVATAVSAITAFRNLLSVTTLGARPGVERSISDIASMTIAKPYDQFGRTKKMQGFRKGKAYLPEEP
jgi:hypothetical protein